MTTCSQTEIQFQALPSRRLVANFEAGHVTSEAGGLLLRELDGRRRILERLALCFTDARDPARIRHSLPELVSQRVMALALGWEDLVDHDRLRHDPMISLLAGKASPLEETGAGKSTLNRLELSPDLPLPEASRYHRITWNQEKIDRLLLDIACEAEEETPAEIVLDLDATDDPLHGHQEGRFFHGYYDAYCYLPLYIFWGDHVLCARLRPSNQDGAAGWEEELPRIVSHLRERWPGVRIVLRADSGFCREALMVWCESEGVDFVFGLAKNSRLADLIREEMAEAGEEFKRTREASRRFGEFMYQTLESWSRERRVVGKAEWLEKGANPRFIVTSLTRERLGGRELYEDFYCRRGEAENRIKEQQLDLFADRTSTAFLKSNQLRLYFSTFAYMLVSELRRVGLKGTKMERSTCASIRLKLLKAGALVKASVRRVVVSFASGWPSQELFERCLGRVQSGST